MILDDESRDDLPLGERLARLEEKHISLSVIVHEDHNVVSVLKDAIKAMQFNLEKVTDLLESLVERDKAQQETCKKHDQDIYTMRRSQEREAWGWSLTWKILAGIGVLFISMNSGGDLILHHLLGITKP